MHPPAAVMLALGLMLCALAAPTAGQTAHGCKSVINSTGTQRVYRRNPGLQSASELDLPLTASKCVAVCSNQPDIISFAAAGEIACFCGFASPGSLSTGASCSAVCSPSANCTTGTQNISDAAILNPIVNPTMTVATAGPSLTDTVPMVNVSASVRFSALTTVTAFDYDPYVKSVQQPLVNVPSASIASVLVRPTYTNRRGLLCLRYATTEATSFKTATYKVFYPLSGASIELDYGNNTPGYYRVLEELRAYFRVNLGSNMTARVDFGDTATPPIQFASLTDTFPVTYRRDEPFVNQLAGWLDPANTITVFTSFRIDANVTISTVAALVNSSAPVIVSFVVLRPLCNQSTYCYRANACATNCSALPGGRATACGAAAATAWSALPRACRSSAASSSPALFSGGSYYTAQIVNATLSPGSSFQTIKLSTGLNCIPGDLLALREYTPVVVAQNGSSSAEREVALPWTNFGTTVLNGISYTTVNLASATLRSSAKAVQFFGNRQLSVLATHRYRTFNCNWTISYCNNEYPFNVTVIFSSTVGGSASTTNQMPVIIQIPIMDANFTAPLYNKSYTNVPFLVIQHSGSKPAYSWSVNDSSLSNFNATVLANNYYSFAADGFYNVCLTTVNRVSSYFHCKTVIIQHQVASGVTNVITDLLLSTTPTSLALSTVYLTWNASTADVPTNVTANLDMGDGTALVTVIVDWSTSRRVVQYQRNYSRGTYSRSVVMYNQVSSQSHTSVLVVQETLMNPVLVASSYIVPPGVPFTFTLSLAWGSDYNATIFYGDGRSASLVVTSNNRSVMFTHSYAAIGNYSVSCVISNRVSGLTVALDRGFVESMYSPLGFALTASRISLLKRPDNTTNTQLQICRNATINDAQPLYESRYNVDLGDGSSPRLTGVSLPSCLTTNATLNAACASVFGAGFVHCQLVPILHYISPGNFTATVLIYNKAGGVNITWYQEIYSQIVNLNREITLYPVYSGNTLVQNAARTFIYPLENPLRFFAVTQFGQLSPLVYNWDFGDGRTVATIVNVIEHQYTKPQTFTVKVNVTNPLMWQADSYNIELRRAVVNIRASTPVSYPMNYPYEIIVDFAAFPTLACFTLDFSSFGSRVSANSSVHMFGHAATCSSLAPFSTYASGSFYWDPVLTNFYLSNYAASVTSTPPSTKVSIIKVFNNYGAAQVTLFGANSFSSVTFPWTMTVSKGFCSNPVAGLESSMKTRRFKRNAIITTGGDIQISCFNTSTHVKWTVEEMNNGVWTDYIGRLQTFFTTYRPSENLNAQLEGDWYGSVNANLRRLVFPAFSLNIQRTYRVCVQLTMNDETTINSTDCVTFEVYKAPLEPCFRMHYSSNKNVTWTAIEDPAQAPYTSLIRIDPSCSVNPNKFEASGLASQKTCWSPAFYCQRDCEANIVFGANYSYNASAQTPCTKYSTAGATFFEKTCFIKDALLTWGHMPPLSVADWRVDVAANNYGPSIVKKVYEQITDWKADAAGGKFNYLYVIVNGMIYIDTSFSFESGSLKIYVVMTDLCDDLPPIATESQLMITKGAPPIVSGVCVSNCYQKMLPMKRNNGADCNANAFNVNPLIAIKFQTRIENYIAGVTYNFAWQSTPLNNSVKFCPSDLSLFALDSDFNNLEIMDREWTKKDGIEYASTGRSAAGLALNPPNFYPKSNGYYIIRMRAWRGSDSTNYGFKFLYINVNNGPDRSLISSTVFPLSGEAMKTKFTISCNYPATESLLYTIGYSTKDSPKNQSQCTPLILNSATCQTEAILPAGLDSLDNNLTICISVYDGASSEGFQAQLRVKVKSRVIQPTELKSNSPFLTQIIGAGDSGNIAQMAASALPLLTSINQMAADATTPNTTTNSSSSTPSAEDSAKAKEEAEEAKKLRTAAKEAIVAAATSAILVSNPNASTSEQLQTLMLAGTLLTAASKVSTEISSKNMESSTKAIDAMSLKLMSLSTGQAATYDQIKDTVTMMLSASANILSASTSSIAQQNSSESEKEKPESVSKRKAKSSVPRNILANCQNAGQALGNKLVVGEPPSVVRLPSLSLSVEKQSASSIMGKSFGTSEGKSASSSGVSIGTGNGGNGSVFVEPSPFDPTEMQASQVVIAQVVQNKANIFSLATGSSRMTSPVMTISMTNDKQYTFPISDLSDDSLMEMWVPSDTDAVAALKPDYNTTRLKSQKMLITKMNVKPYDGLFIQVQKHVFDLAQAAAAAVSDGRSADNASTTTATTPLTATPTTMADSGADLTEFLVYVSVGVVPTDTKYDFFCQLPHTQPHICSRSTARMAASVSAAGTGSGATATAAVPTTPSTVPCNCSQSQSGTPCRQLSAADAASAVSATNSSWQVAQCNCNSTGCFRAASASQSEVKETIRVADKWTCYFSPTTLGTNGTAKDFFIGIRAVRSNSRNRTVFNPNLLPSLDLNLPDSAYVEANYSVLSFTTGCYFVDTNAFSLNSTGCYLSECSIPNATLCYSSHLTSFMSSFVVPPIQIDTGDSAWLKLDSNPIALALIISIICFYFIILIWVRRLDERDVERVGITPLMDNHPSDNCQYELTFWTGVRGKSGTTANVSLILYGEEDETEPRLIMDPKRPVLTRNSVDSFLLTTPYYLGKLTHLRIWHDNSGSSPKWYLNRLLVKDLQTQEKYFFICNRWFAFDEDDGMVDRVMTVSGMEEMRKFDVVFWSKAQKNLKDGHIWASVITRPPRSKFTRVQRATVCLVLLLSTMMVNLMFYGQSAKVQSPQLVEFGPVKFTAHSIYLATVSTLIILPVNMLIVIMFKSRRSKPPPGVKDIARRPPAAAHKDAGSSEAGAEPAPEAAGRDSEAPPQGNDRWAEVSAVSPRSVQLSARPEPPSASPDESRIDMSPSHRRRDSAADGNEEAEEEKPEKPSTMSRLRPYIRRMWPLPWWTHYSAYALTVVWVAVCTYLMVEFGGVLGEQKTAEWLAAMFVTLFQSIILVQPVKILVMAIVYALLVKKIEEDEDEVTKELVMSGVPKMHERMTIKDLTNPEKMKAFLKSRKVPPPPDLETLKQLREQRIREQAMNDILADIAFYILFLVVLTMAAYTNQDYKSYIQNRFVKDTITGKQIKNPNIMNLDGVQRMEDAYTYVSQFAAPLLYPTKCYHNTTCPMAGNGWSWDPSFYLVRNAQLRQLRNRKPGNCHIVSYFKDMFPECRQEYSTSGDDEATYMPQWMPFNSSYAAQREWRYTSAATLFGTPYAGHLTTYAGGGYVASLGKTISDARTQVDYLRNNSWIDKHTRAVFFEFLIYNPNINQFTFAEVLLEVFNGGSFVKYPQFYTLRLNRYVGASGVFFIATDALALVFILMFVYRECKQLKLLKWGYFQDVFNVMDFGLMICCIAEVILSIVRITMQQAVSYVMNKHPDRFINFQWLIMWYQMNQLFLGLVVFIFTIRFLRLLAFNRKIMMLGHVLRIAAKPLGYFMIVFYIMFFAFAQLGYFMFNRTVVAFKSISDSVKTLSVMTLNKFDFTQFVVGGGQLGMWFFFVYMVFVSFILINFFITIINMAFAQVKREWKDSANKYEIVDYVVTSLKSLFGFNPQKRLNHIDHQFAYMAETSKFEQQVDELDEKLFVLEFYIRNSCVLGPDEVPLKKQKRLQGKVFVSDQ